MRVANPMRLCRLLYRLDEERYAAMTGQVQFMATKCVAALDISLLFPPTRASKGGLCRREIAAKPLLCSKPSTRGCWRAHIGVVSSFSPAIALLFHLSLVNSGSGNVFALVEENST